MASMRHFRSFQFHILLGFFLFFHSCFQQRSKVRVSLCLANFLKVFIVIHKDSTLRKHGMTFAVFNFIFFFFFFFSFLPLNFCQRSKVRVRQRLAYFLHNSVLYNYEAISALFKAFTWQRKVKASLI